MHVFYTPDIAVTCEMPEEEAAHCLRVLRLGVGDEVMLTDGKGCFYKAVISAATGKRCQVKVTETIEQEPLWNGHLHLAMAPTKNMDRIEWLAEKATEIGFDELSFLNCRYSERKVIKTERVEKIVVSAVKPVAQGQKAGSERNDGFCPFCKAGFRRTEVYSSLQRRRETAAEGNSCSGRRCAGADWAGR